MLTKITMAASIAAGAAALKVEAEQASLDLSHLTGPLVERAKQKLLTAGEMYGTVCGLELQRENFASSPATAWAAE